MTAATENSIRAMLLNNEEVIFGELNLTKCVLEKLFEADEAQIPQELSNDASKLLQISERMKEAETRHQTSDIYFSEFRPLLHELKVKYGEFLAGDTLKKIDSYEKFMDGLHELMITQDLMILALKEGTDKINQYKKLYEGMVKLSELLEEYLFYFLPKIIEDIKGIALAFLSDYSLKPDRNSQSESVFSYLIGLKNTARAILWQIEEHRVKNGMLPTKLLAINPDIARQIQIQKNQAAIEWAKSRLEQIENIKKAKGYKF